ncbi:hypothetical protein N7466_001413 [Penicillium verhagenii]|uniref:uncharacterized protein n=1 Tax=Penicillium verhagenii TaxID=1562060 RepID=UPI0025453754|nr:uncharacterized protein N7466_001413 [Penicillium verhagenii]KAJ5938279.1 hypothetical protein N7466_001413 [Penicillium verhagenii]
MATAEGEGPDERLSDNSHRDQTIVRDFTSPLNSSHVSPHCALSLTICSLLRIDDIMAQEIRYRIGLRCRTDPFLDQLVPTDATHVPIKV